MMLIGILPVEIDGTFDGLVNQKLTAYGKRFNTLRNYNRHPPIEAFPSRVHFIPDASSQLFAVPCGGSGAIHIHSLAYEKSLDIVYPSPEIFKEGNTERFDAYACWGVRASKGWMFAGTDPPKDGMGSVVCWDVGARAERFVDTPRDDKDGGASQWDGRGVQHFELENGATQCLGVDYWGERVAIVSYDTTPFRGAGDPGLSLRIYDIRAPRSLPSSPTISLNLDTLLSSPSLLSGERAGASSVLFSPCTTYIAVARENNIAQVFDARFVGLGDSQRVLMECRHETEHEGPEITVQGKAYSRYGIAAMDWMDASLGPRRAPGVLVTGGDDGAVRSWDLRRSPDDLSQGRNLLSMDPQQRLVGIAAFSLGDVYAGERALIVGDMNGTIQEYLDWGDV
ncbi:hypothetical protein DL93DRAFT_939902 [Clavulina sp. PMI_390]|nr:hypothetical protein DL93DRAFT_939902 [Clavulina sp. PMI_390]